MPNRLDATGLTLATRQEWLEFFTLAFQQIYGTDINIESSTPDGQLINIIIQVIMDLQDLVATTYNTFDPDNAMGNILDQRVAINGIQRQAGTYTITPVTVVNDQSVNLYGIDDSVGTPPVRDDGNEIYTISDNAGNRWYLETTELGLAAGSHVLNFRAATPGANLTIPNTINVQITIVLGVVSVNNPTTFSVLGINEESDQELKIRRAKSVSLASQGYLAGLLAALENINGVTSAFVYENTTGSTNIDGVPGHSIWVIVAGSGAPAEIAQAIYTKRNAGCGMFGQQFYTIVQVDGSPFNVYWDNVVTRRLFIFFTATSINGVTAPSVQAIREGLPALLTPAVYQELNINGIATLVQQIDPNTLVENCRLTLATEQNLELDGVPASGGFKISYNGEDSATINWNDNIATIQSIVQAVTGLASAVVTGSLASQLVNIDLTALSDVLALIVIKDNNLQTSAPANIAINVDVPGTATLLPPAKTNQLVLAAENIVITPMQLLPVTFLVGTTGQVQFFAYGGYGEYTYSISVNNSGGNIDPVSGLYTAGAIGNVIDTVLVTDEKGNTQTATVSVTA